MKGTNNANLKKLVGLVNSINNGNTPLETFRPFHLGSGFVELSNGESFTFLWFLFLLFLHVGYCNFWMVVSELRCFKCKLVRNGFVIKSDVMRCRDSGGRNAGFRTQSSRFLALKRRGLPPALPARSTWRTTGSSLKVIIPPFHLLHLSPSNQGNAFRTESKLDFV